ncbi:MAG TPA: hypothetical protein VNO31_03945 [Umezawaea sp.]|nr:hypothetical protein [Umezawaea sp.]
MGRGVKRYLWIAAAGAVTGVGWWFFFWAPAEFCSPEGSGCAFGVVLLLSVMVLTTGLLPWLVLHRQRVGNPGAAALTGLGVSALLGWILLSDHSEAGVPLQVWLTMTLVGTVSFLVAAVFTS